MLSNLSGRHGTKTLTGNFVKLWENYSNFELLKHSSSVPDPTCLISLKCFTGRKKFPAAPEAFKVTLSSEEMHLCITRTRFYEAS